MCDCPGIRLQLSIKSLYLISDMFKNKNVSKFDWDDSHCGRWFCLCSFICNCSGRMDGRDGSTMSGLRSPTLVKMSYCIRLTDIYVNNYRLWFIMINLLYCHPLFLSAAQGCIEQVKQRMLVLAYLHCCWLQYSVSNPVKFPFLPSFYLMKALHQWDTVYPQIELRSAKRFASEF